MFSGIIEETGTVKKAARKADSVQFSISAAKTLKSVNAGSSISVNGVCLTVLHRSKNEFKTQAVEETLKKTNLGLLKPGNKVNLERPLRFSGRVDGHFVLGHVDCVGVVRLVEIKKSSKVFWIQYPKQFRKYIIRVGSIAVNGVSLTISDDKAGLFGVSLIPHTLQVTNFGVLKRGAKVNLEFDILGKYIENIYRVRGR
ncbi:MAG: riboflavin synthase [Ignavibacteriales bacterium]|nr:riboflavin synthase [Ignavibacteriales bacterium]